MGHCGVMQLPAPIRAAVGLVATAADEARHLPDRALELPMLAVSTALQVSLRAQQRYARLAARGDQVLNPTSASDDPPEWATFDEPISPEELRRTALAQLDDDGSQNAATRLFDQLFGASDPSSGDRSDDSADPAALADAAAIEAATQGHDNVTPIRKAAVPATDRDADGGPAADSGTESTKPGQAGATSPRKSGSTRPGARKSNGANTGAAKTGGTKSGNGKTGNGKTRAAKTSGSKTGNGKTGTPKTGGAKPGGTKTGGTKTAGTRTAGTKTAGTTSAGTKATAPNPPEHEASGPEQPDPGGNGKSVSPPRHTAPSAFDAVDAPGDDAPRGDDTAERD